MKVSSSIMSTSVAISAASSRPNSSTNARSFTTSISRMWAASGSENPSSATRRKACRGRGVIWASFCSPGSDGFRGYIRAHSRKPSSRFGKETVERNAWSARVLDDGTVGDQRLKGRCHIRSRLTLGCPGEGSRIAAQEGQVLCYGRCWHGDPPIFPTSIPGKNSRATTKFHTAAERTVSHLVMHG